MRIIGVFTVLAAAVLVQSDAPDGYIENKADGKAYKLVYQAQSWNRARVECERQGVTLAVPKSEDEFLFIQKLVRAMSYPSITGAKYKLLVWLGINNWNDDKTWKNIYGENITDTGFHKWSEADTGFRYLFSDDPREPHCAGMDAHNPGLRQWWCQKRQPFVCQLDEGVNLIHPPVNKEPEQEHLNLTSTLVTV